MESILRFSDLACLNESASGSLGAGLAVFARADFPVARGFVVTPVAFSDFLKKDDIRAALDLHESGAEDPKESWRNVKAVFHRARILWNHEMEIMSAMEDMNSVVSVVTSSKYGSSSTPIYASSGRDLLDAIKHSWLKWLKGNMEKLEQQDMPAVIVREVFDSESSLQMRKKAQEIMVKAVFGLPEGLQDPAISGDLFRMNREGELEHMEQREQAFQYIMDNNGPSKVELDPAFGTEEKASGQMLASLEDTMAFMWDNPGIERCGVCFVSSRPVICSAMLVPEQEAIKELPPRESSLTLMEKTRPMAPRPKEGGPVIATRLLLRIDDKTQVHGLDIDYVEGIMLSKDIKPNDMAEILDHAKRGTGSRVAIIEMDRERLEDMGATLQDVSSRGMEAGIMIPEIRSSEELAKVKGLIDSAIGDTGPKPRIWLRIMYPSNLFFMDSLADMAHVLALDLDMLGRLLLGGGEDGKWLNYSTPALEKALKDAIESCGKRDRIAVMSKELVSMPGLLEFLVREGIGFFCVEPGDFQTIRHIVASVEKRILLESGRS